MCLHVREAKKVHTHYFPAQTTQRVFEITKLKLVQYMYNNHHQSSTYRYTMINVASVSQKPFQQSEKHYYIYTRLECLRIIIVTVAHKRSSSEVINTKERACSDYYDIVSVHKFLASFCVRAPVNLLLITCM